MFKWGIRSRLIAAFLLVIISLLLMLGSYILWFFNRYNLENLTSHLLSEAVIAEQLLKDDMTNPAAKQNIDTRIKELGAKRGLRLTVIEPSGAVIADSQENPALMDNHLHRPEVWDAMSGNTGISTRFSTTLGENLLYVAIPIRNHNETIGAIRMAASLSYVETGFTKIKTILLTAFFLTSLLAVVLSISLARRYTAPLEEITDGARKIANGKLTQRIHIRTGDELELLAHTINNLASNLDDKINEITAEKKKLELILQHMDNAVILLDKYGNVSTANKQAISMFGITSSMLGQHNIQVIGNSLLDRAARETVTKRESRVIDLKTHIHGIKRVLQVFIAPIITYETDSCGALCVFHDITVLQAIYEKQAEFVANATHELATPLTSIKGFTETLLDGAITDHQSAIRFLKIIHDEADRMQRLIKDLLELAKLDSCDYRQHIVYEPTEISALFTAITQELSPEWRRKEQTVIIKCPDTHVLANPDWLKQALVNLLENSIKYTPEGGKICLECRHNKNTALLIVKDTGIGIPAEDLPRIFDRFYRVDRTRTRMAGGTGLGLSIVKFIVEMMGGKIEVQSEVGIGTAFTLTLPLTEIK